MRLCRALAVKLELKTEMIFTQIWHTKMQKKYARLVQEQEI
jgi:hypothetical protein